MCELNHSQLGCKDRYEGESDRQYEHRQRVESALAAYEPKAKPPADPFAGIPQADEAKW